MTWIGADLDPLPTTIPVKNVDEGRMGQTIITPFAGKQEQRTGFGGPRRATFRCTGTSGDATRLQDLLDFWDDKEDLTPFTFPFNGTTYYVRFADMPSVAWSPPASGDVTFMLIEMHSAEIVV